MNLRWSALLGSRSNFDRITVGIRWDLGRTRSLTESRPNFDRNRSDFNSPAPPTVVLASEIAVDADGVEVGITTVRSRHAWDAQELSPNNAFPMPKLNS